MGSISLGNSVVTSIQNLMAISSNIPYAFIWPVPFPEFFIFPKNILKSLILAAIRQRNSNCDPVLSDTK